MASKIDNFGNKRNTNGFDKNPQNIMAQGSKPSIKKKLEEIANGDGIMVFKRKDVVSITDDEVKIKVPNQLQLAMKLWQWAVSKKGNDSIRAIDMIMQHFDGRPRQAVELTGKDGKDLIPNRDELTDEQLAKINNVILDKDA